MLAIEATCCRIVHRTCGNIDNKAQTTHSILHNATFLHLFLSTKAIDTRFSHVALTNK